MTSRPFPKTGIVSHILPPSPSGQATVLARLLEGIDPNRYVLLSRERYDGMETGENQGNALPGRRYAFRSPSPAPPVWRLAGSFLRFARDTFVGIRARAGQIEEVLRKEGCDLLVACSGDLLDFPAACLAGGRTGIPFVPYLFDDYLYQWTGSARSASRRLEPWVMRHARGAIVPNEFLREEYARRYGARTVVVRNPCPLPDLGDLDRAPRPFPGGAADIVYTGAVYHANVDAFRNLVSAVRTLGRTDVRIHLYTAQSPEEIGRLGIAGQDVVHHPHIPNRDVPPVLRQASVLFLPLGFDTPIPEVIRTSAPGKTGEYLSVGRPVLVHAPEDSFVSWYFRENRCGLVVDRNDPDLLSASIGALLADETLRSELGARARAAAERDFDQETVRPRFREALSAFAEEGRR
jgi:glycosyltransferase involved in cell wall biosynthesis